LVSGSMTIFLFVPRPFIYLEMGPPLQWEGGGCWSFCDVLWAEQEFAAGLCQALFNFNIIIAQFYSGTIGRVVRRHCGLNPRYKGYCIMNGLNYLARDATNKHVQCNGIFSFKPLHFILQMSVISL
jgi:hypothetical protein